MHKWKEFYLNDDGTYNGYRTCLLEWRCKNCGEKIELPLGMKPSDYNESTKCKGENDNVYRSDPNEMRGASVSGTVRLQTENSNHLNRHEVRKLRVQGQLQSEKNLEIV